MADVLSSKGSEFDDEPIPCRSKDSTKDTQDHKHEKILCVVSHRTCYLHIVLGEGVGLQIVALEHDLKRIIRDRTYKIGAENELYIEEADCFLQHKHYTTDRGTKGHGNARSCAYDHEIAHFRVGLKLFDVSGYARLSKDFLNNPENLGTDDSAKMNERALGAV